jgi:hypothetical protein
VSRNTKTRDRRSIHQSKVAQLKDHNMVAHRAPQWPPIYVKGVKPISIGTCMLGGESIGPLKRKSLSDSVQGKPDGSDDKRSGDAITLAFGDLATGLRRPGASAGRSSRAESRVRGRCSTAKMRPDSRNFTGKPQALKDLHSAENICPRSASINDFAATLFRRHSSLER